MCSPVRVPHQCECSVCQNQSDIEIVRHHRQINLLLSRLSEPQRRWYVGVLSQAPDSPSDGQLSRITGLDEKTIHRGRQEMDAELLEAPLDRQRHAGGGRLLSEKKDPALEPALLQLVAPHTAGDPMSERKWLNCRLADVEQKLDEQGHPASPPVISRLLKKHHYRLRVNAKEVEGPSHPERDAQFQYILKQRAQQAAAGQPCLSVDTKKKELIGNFKNPGQSWGTEAERVNVHDFPSEAEGRAIPYGIYDQQHNCGTVYVGQSADTPMFAVDNLARWCETEMPIRFPGATSLLIEADSGGSNGARSRVWKQQLQEKVADRFGLTVTVCHYPTGASKWNPIEHRLFSEISKTWAGCPLRSYDLMLQYIRETKTQTGLTVQAFLVTDKYETGVKVSDEVMASLNLQRHEVCPQWNYTIRPRLTASTN